MSSWYDALADRYADWSSASVAADVPFYVGLARDADGSLVELAVGTGRVAIPVAKATGRRVIGIDSSSAMLAQARVRAVEEGVELAVAVNGRVRGLTRCFGSNGKQRFDVLVPESSLREGFNEVDVFAVRGHDRRAAVDWLGSNLP